MLPYLRQATHEVLCHQEYLTLCGDLTGRAVSAYSTTYPPDTVFGYMANELCKGHQAALVSLKGQRQRVHVVVFHHAGDTVSGPCLGEMVSATEARLGCQPRRRTELVQQRIELIEAQIRQKQAWIEAQRATIRTQVRVAANTPAVVLTHPRGQLLEFASDGPYAGIQIRLDGPFAYQFPMPLFQTWTQLWPVSSQSVKEQLLAITITDPLPSLAEVLFSQITAHWLEKVPDFELVERPPP